MNEQLKQLLNAISVGQKEIKRDINVSQEETKKIQEEMKEAVNTVTVGLEEIKKAKKIRKVIL